MFSETRLDLGFDYGTVATITTKTTVIELNNGREQRTIDWQQPLLSFNVGQVGVINADLESFIAFHRARKGAYEGFRFKDWSDYQLSDQLITLNENLQAQLFKTYTVAGFSVKRPLTKIVEGTVAVSVGNSPVTDGWEVDLNTGVITFEEEPVGAIRVSCEFDVPVRFESDKSDLRFEAYETSTGNKIFNWENLTLTEVRIPAALPIPIDTIPQSLTHTIDLGFDYGTVGGNRFNTRVEKLTSGQEKRVCNWTNPKGTWEIGSRTLLKSELDYLIALFRVCRGKAVSFLYFDRAEESPKSVRFGEDAISFRFDAYEEGTGQVIFYLSGVPLVGLPVSQTGNYLVRTKLRVVWRDLATQGQVIVNIREGTVEDVLDFPPIFGIPFLTWETVQDGYSYWGFQYGKVSDGISEANVGIETVDNSSVFVPQDLVDLTNNFQQTVGIRCQAICERVTILSVEPV